MKTGGQPMPTTKWDKVIPWLHAHELLVFLIPLGFLIVVGLGSC